MTRSSIIITLFLTVAWSCSWLMMVTTAYDVNYDVYHTLASYEADIAAMANDASLAPILKVNSNARSVEGRPIHWLHLSNHRRPLMVQSAGAARRVRQRKAGVPATATPTTPTMINQNGNNIGVDEHHQSHHAARLAAKPRVMMLFGEHARELVVVESFFMMLRNITNGYHMPCHTPEGHFARWVLNHVDLHMIGLLNPDGKAHMEHDKQYCWRGNARGVDLNRNADWQFNGPGSSSQPGTEEYNGGTPFSEPESLLLKMLAEEHHYDAYINLHSGEQQVFVPFVDTKSKNSKARRPTTDEELRLASSIVANSNGWFRNSGIAYEMNSYSADGAIFDWMAGVMKVPYVICAEIWGDGQTAPCFQQFNPSAERLHDDLRRIHPIYITTLIHVVEALTGVIYDGPPHPPPAAAAAAAAASSSATTPILDQLCEAEDRLDELFEELGNLS